MNRRCHCLVPTPPHARHGIESLESRTYFNPVVFSKAVEFPTGTYPSDVITADLANNGQTDVITSDYGSASIAVLASNGNGTLQSPVFYPVGANPQALAVGDFNGDGIPDIVTANSAANSISILLGNGDGTFRSQIQYPTGIRPESVAVADLTGNGLLDIVTVNEYSDDISVFLNQGNGSFAPAVNYPVGLNPTGLAIADLNGDGLPDIVTVNPVNSNVHVLLNKGGGTFTAPVVYATGAAGSAIGIMDVNSDGRPDIITANLQGTSASELLGVGDGTFDAHTDFTTGAFPFSITIADINGDGRPDVITADNYDDSVGVLVHNFIGGFNDEIGFKTGPNTAPVAVAVADLNGDAEPDLIAADFNTSTVSVLLNKTVFVPQISTSISLTTGQNPVEAGNGLTLTVQVTPASAGKTPLGGRVQFFDGDKVLAAPIITSSGTVTIHHAFTAGTISLVAHYSGNKLYGQSISARVIEQVVAVAEATPLVAVAIVALHVPSAVVPGEHASAALSITDQGDGRAIGRVGVQLYASTDGAIDSSAIALTPSPISTSINLAGGQSTPMDVSFNFPESLLPGQYTILAALTPVRGLTTAQVSWVPAVSATPIQAVLELGTLFAPTATLTGSLFVV